MEKSLKKMSKNSHIKYVDLFDVYKRGVGAYKTNPESVRRGITGSQQWGLARVKAFIKKVSSIKKGSRKTINHDVDIARKYIKNVKYRKGIGKKGSEKKPVNK